MAVKPTAEEMKRVAIAATPLLFLAAISCALTMANNVWSPLAFFIGLICGRLGMKLYRYHYLYQITGYEKQR